MSGSIGVCMSDGAPAGVVTPQWRPCHTAVPTYEPVATWRHEACTTRFAWHRRMQQATSCRQCCVACTGPRHRRHHHDSTAWTGAHNKRVLSDLDTRVSGAPKSTRTRLNPGLLPFVACHWYVCARLALHYVTPHYFFATDAWLSECHVRPLNTDLGRRAGHEREFLFWPGWPRRLMRRETF